MKILLVEDDIFFQKFYSLKLAALSYEVFVAKNGQECMEKVSVFNPNLILLDLIMPIKDGFSVLESLSKDKILSKIPVIVFSTLNQEQDMSRVKQLGAVDFVNKSFFDFDTLVKKIQVQINK